MTDEPATTEAPFSDPEAEEGESAAAQARSGIRVRLGELFGRGDPVLGVLVTSTFVLTLGRGVFLTLTVLYLTVVARLTPGEIALASTSAAVVGIGASYLGGWLADRLSARKLLISLEIINSVVLFCYVFVGDLVLAIIIGCLNFAASSGAHSANAAIIARGFEGPRRIRARAVLRTVTNVGISIGSGAAALALVINTPEAYRVLLGAAAVVSLVSVAVLFRLPAYVDAGRGAPAEAEATAPVKGRNPWRDPRYLGFVALSSIFGIQFGVFEFGVPLWIEHHTDAPLVLVSILLILNTVIVTAFTVTLSRGTEDPHRAGRVFVVSGVLMAVACVVYALAAGAPIWFAIVVLLLAGVAHAFAEVLSQGAGWGLAFELADQRSVGAYQGMVGMGWGVLSAVGPPLIAVTALAMGFWGWIILAGMFLLSSFGVLLIGRRAAAQFARERAAAPAEAPAA